MREKRKKWVRRTILILGTIITALFLFLDPIVRSSVRRDKAGQILQTAAALVVTLVPPGSSEMGNPTTPEIMIRFHDKLYYCTKAVDFDKLRKDQPAMITYLTGKSGKIYVEKVAPLETIQNLSTDDASSLQPPRVK